MLGDNAAIHIKEPADRLLCQPDTASLRAYLGLLRAPFAKTGESTVLVRIWRLVSRIAAPPSFKAQYIISNGEEEP